MHEVSLGGVIRDYLSGEERDNTTYEDLRQALARYLVEERGYAASDLAPRYAVRYVVDGREERRDADIAFMLPGGLPGLFVVFCAGQIHTYQREVISLARLALPAPCPLGVVTDLTGAELFATRDGALLASGLSALPGPERMTALAREYGLPPLSREQREKESRILYTYTGFLKTCCAESCSL